MERLSPRKATLSEEHFGNFDTFGIVLLEMNMSNRKSVILSRRQSTLRSDASFALETAPEKLAKLLEELSNFPSHN